MHLTVLKHDIVKKIWTENITATYIVTFWKESATQIVIMWHHDVNTEI